MEIREIKCQRILSPTGIGIADYVINPYRGCCCQCLYCYARSAKYFQKNPSHNTVDVKINAPALLEKELADKRPSRVLIGSTTETYQPAEQKYRLTRRLLEILTAHKIPVTILTRSPFIEDDIPLLCTLREHEVYLTINSFLPAVTTVLEPRSPAMRNRIQLLAALTRAGISVTVHIGPFIPFITSLTGLLEDLSDFNGRINFELYNPVQGQFEYLHKQLSRILPRQAMKLKRLFSDENAYSAYCNTLKKTVMEHINRTPQPVAFYFPDFNRHYECQLFTYHL